MTIALVKLAFGCGQQLRIDRFGRRLPAELRGSRLFHQLAALSRAVSISGKSCAVHFELGLARRKAIKANEIGPLRFGSRCVSWPVARSWAVAAVRQLLSSSKQQRLLRFAADHTTSKAKSSIGCAHSSDLTGRADVLGFEGQGKGQLFCEPPLSSLPSALTFHMK
jgi:hypothetical protein